MRAKQDEFVAAQDAHIAQLHAGLTAQNESLQASTHDVATLANTVVHLKRCITGMQAQVRHNGSTVALAVHGAAVQHRKCGCLHKTRCRQVLAGTANA